MNSDLDIQKVIETLKNGGIVLYPTDTVYGLGVDATNIDAIRKLYDLKGRSYSKPTHVIVSDLEMAGEYAEINDKARELAERFLPGPLTIILKAKDSVPSELIGGGETIGIRIPDNSFCLEFTKQYGRPITTPSANKSGEETLSLVSEISKQFDKKIDFIVDQGKLGESKPSTIVDLSEGDIKIIREGAISI